MKTYTNKTQPTAISPETFLKENLKGKEKKHREALALIDLYTKVTGSPCVMWNKIFGFGKYHYLDSKGGEHTHLITGFTSSSAGFTLYNMIGWENGKKDMENLGKYKFSGKSCLAIKSIEDIDLKVLRAVIKRSYAEMKKRYKTEK
ncbi:DUF1801 domain-containing protein [Candidatus Uhrbacteria bacterium]|jgi:hypothetical protein|nr:MAG: DUF1801 domain-containing protein [Candidatus Uhrbacteria bacterium]